jgi:glycosyltransferase involved in cell wall biosynthesis
MNIVFFAHPTFLGHQSMPRFAQMLVDGMRARGHTVELWMPEAHWFKLPAPGALRKWFSYVDQYAVFPAKVRRDIKQCAMDTLFVFTDHALGPWVPLVADRRHAIHCHDFLAQQSALNHIPESSTSWTGKQYQAFIRRGYSKGKNFISVSEKTREDLRQFLPAPPLRSEVVYNGLNQAFEVQDPTKARNLLGQRTGLNLLPGYLLHVGGNQWYKNRSGVIEIYTSWRATSQLSLPLLLIGSPADAELQHIHAQSPYAQDIHLLTGIEDEAVRLAYSGATAFLFPSLAEGFGWPIAEAMASGCPVITTNEAPMTEVGAAAAFYVPRRPAAGDTQAWAAACARVVQQVVALSPAARQAAVAAGLANASRFEADAALDRIEAIYQDILATFEHE